MISVSFLDKEIYKNMKYPCYHTLMYKTDTHVAVELVFIDKDSNYHLLMPFDHELKDAEVNKDENKDYLSFWNKYRKWQKRKLYTIEEFNNLFET